MQSVGWSQVSCPSGDNIGWHREWVTDCLYHYSLTLQSATFVVFVVVCVCAEFTVVTFTGMANSCWTASCSTLIVCVRVCVCVRAVSSILLGAWWMADYETLHVCPVPYCQQCVKFWWWPSDPNKFNKFNCVCVCVCIYIRGHVAILLGAWWMADYETLHVCPVPYCQKCVKFWWWPSDPITFYNDI